MGCEAEVFTQPGAAPSDGPDPRRDPPTRTVPPEQRVRAPLGRMLAQVERQVARMLEARLREDGLTPDQWRVLDLLADGAGHPMTEIATAIVRPPATLTKIIDKLVNTAVVYRLVDERDRRRVLAFISDTGRELHERLAPLVSTAELDAVAVFGSDAPVLLDLLGRLADASR
jgi:DNA-binding MarR family transcriptional regulator